MNSCTLFCSKQKGSGTSPLPHPDSSRASDCSSWHAERTRISHAEIGPGQRATSMLETKPPATLDTSGRPAHRWTGAACMDTISSNLPGNEPLCVVCQVSPGRHIVFNVFPICDDHVQ